MAIALIGAPSEFLNFSGKAQNTKVLLFIKSKLVKFSNIKILFFSILWCLAKIEASIGSTEIVSKAIPFF